MISLVDIWSQYLSCTAPTVSSSQSWTGKNAMTHLPAFASLEAALVVDTGPSDGHHRDSSAMALFDPSLNIMQRPSIMANMRHNTVQGTGGGGAGGVDGWECKLIQSVWPWWRSHLIETGWRVRKITPGSRHVGNSRNAWFLTIVAPQSSWQLVKSTPELSDIIFLSTQYFGGQVANPAWLWVSQFLRYNLEFLNVRLHSKSHKKVSEFTYQSWF